MYLPSGTCLPASRLQNFHDTLAHWGWRRKPDLMLQIIEELTTGQTRHGGS
jgi:ABC-type transporter lipoprotein component MlaA